jgi:hypothetical protein
MFPGRKIDDQAKEAGDGQLFEPGPLDLDGGVIRIRRAAEPAKSAESAESAKSAESAESHGDTEG